jgi:hypothetical protein
MKLPQNVPLFRSFKFAPFALISLFLFTNVTGILFSHVLAPIANASSPDLNPFHQTSRLQVIRIST